MKFSCEVGCLWLLPCGRHEGGFLLPVVIRQRKGDAGKPWIHERLDGCCTCCVASSRQCPILFRGRRMAKQLPRRTVERTALHGPTHPASCLRPACTAVAPVGFR